VTDLRDALSCASDTVIVYSDAGRLKLWAGSREKTLAVHADALLSALGDRTIVIPTFAYRTWCEDGVYNPGESPSELGGLSEYLRVHYGRARTLTPVFCFSVLRWKSGSDHPDSFPWLTPTPFGVGSVFEWLIAQRATVVAYGAELHKCSACHVNEFEHEVPYRFVKLFEGVIDGRVPWSLLYHVRHPGVRYRWDRVDEMLEPLFTTHDTEVGTVRLSSADRIYIKLGYALDINIHAFVDEPVELYLKYGKPLGAAAMEAA